MLDHHRTRWLDGEIAAWEAEGLVTPEQADALRERYRGPAWSAGGPADAAPQGRLVGTLAVLGAILVGAGVILFFAANWAKIPKAVRVAAIVGAMTASYLGGFEFIRRRNYPRAGQGLILLGTILFGSGIWLIAQIFHLESHYPNGFLYWSLGALATSFAAASAPVAILAGLLLGAWTIAEQAGFERMNLLYPALALLAGLPLARRLRSPLSAAPHLLGLPTWAVMNQMQWLDGDPEAQFLIAGGLTLVGFGCAYLALALLRGASSRAALAGPRGATPWPLAGVALALLGLYLLTFGWNDGRWLAQAERATWAALGGSTPALTLLGSLAAVAVAGLAGAHYRYHRAAAAGRPRDRLAPWLAGATLTVLAAAGALLGSVAVATHRPLIFNLVLFLAIVGVVVAGYRARAPGWINLGLLFFAVDVVTRYFDLLWSLLDRSVFFVGAGLLLLVAGGLLERGRRRLLDDLSAQGVERS